MLANTIENTRCAVDGAVGKLSSKRENDRANEYIQMSQGLAEILDIINEYNKKYVSVEDEDKDAPTEDEEDEGLERVGGKINYENYRVDEEVAYNLYADLSTRSLLLFH